MRLWKRAVCLLLIFSSIISHAQHTTVDFQDANSTSEFGEKNGKTNERVTFYDEETEGSGDPFYDFDHSQHNSDVNGSGLKDTDIVNIDSLYDKGGSGNGNGNYDKQAGNGKGAGKPKKDSDKSEEEKFKEFLVQTQREIVKETLQWDNILTGTLADLNGIFLSQPNLTIAQEHGSKNANNEFWELTSTDSNYLSTKAEYLNSLTKLEREPFASEQKEKLNTVRRDLLSKAPRSPQQKNAKAAGLLSLQYSDMAYIDGQKDEGDFYYEMGVQLASIVTDLVPATALVKDVYGLLVGKDLLTGDELSAFERSLCGTFALAQIVGSLYTAGIGTSMVAAGIKQIRNITKANATAVRLSMKLAKIAEKIPHRVSIALPGHSKSVVLIGRNMDLVRAMRAELEKENVLVKIFDGPVISEKAIVAWKKAAEAAKAVGEKIPDHEIVKMDIFLENKEWIENMIKEGHTILDAGNPTGQEWSIFYEMEKIIVERMKQAGVK